MSQISHFFIVTLFGDCLCSKVCILYDVKVVINYKSVPAFYMIYSIYYDVNRWKDTLYMESHNMLFFVQFKETLVSNSHEIFKDPVLDSKVNVDRKTLYIWLISLTTGATCGVEELLSLSCFFYSYYKLWYPNVLKPCKQCEQIYIYCNEKEK